MSFKVLLVTMLFIAGLSAHDVHNLTEKFWNFHMDPIMFMDGAMASILTIQYNLAAGMLAPFAAERPELRPLMQKMLDFDVSSVAVISYILCSA